jgi:hypothetical protein
MKLFLLVAIFVIEGEKGGTGREVKKEMKKKRERETERKGR